jgi:hypothetical protein
LFYSLNNDAEALASSFQIFCTSKDLEDADKSISDIIAYAPKIDASSIKIEMESTSNNA